MTTPQVPQPLTQLVAVGASAGGVEALSALVATLPPTFPALLVIAQHLDPDRPSYLQSILARRSTLPVHTVVDHEALEPGVVRGAAMVGAGLGGHSRAGDADDSQARAHCHDGRRHRSG